MHGSLDRIQTQPKGGKHTVCRQSTRCWLFLLGALLVFAAPTWAQVNAVTSLAIDPATPTTLYAGTGIGVFKTTDGGATWSAPTAALNVTSLSIDPRTPSTIYTNSHKSTNSGVTWATLGLAGKIVVVDPNNPSNLYSGGGGGIAANTFRSTDGGVTWTEFSEGLYTNTLFLGTPRDYVTIDSLVIDSQTSTLFAGYSGHAAFGVARRSSGSSSWLSSGLPTTLGGHVSSIAIDPSNSQVIYATVRSAFTNNGVIKSADGGASWTYRNQGLPISNDATATAIAIDPQSTSTLYVGLNSGIFKSADGGQTWTTSSDGFPGGAVINVIVVDPRTSSTVFAATSFGIFKSMDSGAHWAATNQGLSSGSPTPPTLTRISPDSVPLDSIVTVRLDETGFSSLSTPVGVNFGKGITVLSAIAETKLFNPVFITATIQVSRDDSALGTRDVTFTTPNGTSNALPFTVTPASQLPPTIGNVSPTVVLQGTTRTLALFGVNFTPSMSATISGPDVTLSSLIVSADGRASVDISVGALASVGPRSIQLSSPSGGTGPAFPINIDWGIPVVTAMNPPFLRAGRTTTVTFTGTRLVPPLTFTTDSDIHIDNVSTDTSFTSATASITVPLNAKLNLHSLQITGGTGQQSQPTKFMVRSLTRNVDFNGDGKADVLWYNPATTETTLWLMDGLRVLSSAVLLRDRDTKITATGDFNGDGNADLVWYNALTGQTSIWLMNGTTVVSSALLVTDLSWHVVGANDFDGDGKSDLVWDNGLVTAVVLMDGTRQVTYKEMTNNSSLKVVATGDFREGIFGPQHSGEGYADILWRNALTGETSATVYSAGNAGHSRSFTTDPNWTVTALPDLDGDGKSDVLWHNSVTFETSSWILNDTDTPIGTSLLTNADWRVTFTGDLDGDYKSDLIWYNPSSGQTVSYIMNGTTYSKAALLLTDPDWKVAAIADFDGDGKMDLLWTNEVSGLSFLWLMDGLTPTRSDWLPINPTWRLITPLH